MDEQALQRGQALIRCDEAQPLLGPAAVVAAGGGGRHARLRPRPPIDAQSGQPLRLPQMSQRVYEGVGRRVVPLARRTQHRRHRGKDHEKVQ